MPSIRGGGLSRHLHPPCRTRPSHHLCVYLGTPPPHAHCQGGAGRSTDGDTHTQAHAHRGRERSPADAPEPPAGNPHDPPALRRVLGRSHTRPAPLRRVGAVGDPPSPWPRPTPSPPAPPRHLPPLPSLSRRPPSPRPLFLSRPRLPPHPAPQRPHPCRYPVCPLPSLLCRRPPVRFRSVLCAASPDSPRTPGSPGASSFVSAPRPPPAAPLAPHSPPQPWRGRRELALLAQRREPRRGPPRAGSFFSLPTRARCSCCCHRRSRLCWGLETLRARHPVAPPLAASAPRTGRSGVAGRAGTGGSGKTERGWSPAESCWHLRLPACGRKG